MYLIPAPARVQKREGAFVVSYETWAVLDAGCGEKAGRQAQLFMEKIKETLGYCPMLTRGSAKKGDILFRQDDGMEAQSYVLEIGPEGVTLSGDEKGLWHGMQTLLQILEQEGAMLPALQIEDHPAIPNRGYYFDCARGRVPKLDWLKKLADRMAYYKLNQLQLYIEHSYLFRGMTELWRDDTPLTAAQIMELDRYCGERGIELVPSLSSFGHLYKLLSTKEYAHLCELPDAGEKPFSLFGRMAHHTVNVTDPDGIALIKSMLKEYMELFSSRQFNLCADETFDLGTGKSRKLVEEKGKGSVYIAYVKELAQFLIDNGRRPMFWGDIIVEFPEMIKELPEETVCLTWGYAKEQSDFSAKAMQEAGAVQYCCPGCATWNEFIPLYRTAYENIRRMCAYAGQYGAIGVLNTDWGDFLHLNQPEFSAPGMIYGAAFSWNAQVPAFEEINRQISRVEYHDSSEKLLQILSEAEEQGAFRWYSACMYWEARRGVSEKYRNEEEIAGLLEGAADALEKNKKLEEIKLSLYRQIRTTDGRDRERIWPFIMAAEGAWIFNAIGALLYSAEQNREPVDTAWAWALAKRLEIWFYYYKEVYRQVSLQSELSRMEAVICWYGDYLRDLK